MRVLSLKDLLLFLNRVRVYAQFGDISIMDINTWNRILNIIDNFSTGTSRTTFLFAGELAFAMVGGDTGECP